MVLSDLIQVYTCLKSKISENELKKKDFGDFKPELVNLPQGQRAFNF